MAAPASSSTGASATASSASTASSACPAYPGAPPPPPPGHFNVLYFAGATTFTGRDHEALAAPLRLAQLFGALEARYPGMRAGVLDASLVTINLAYVDVPAGDAEKDSKDEEDVVIVAGDEVAIIPPVSAG